MKTNSLDFDAQALREKILDLAMRGKLVKQDPNDEPASVLLEKIKAEKAKLVKEGKIKKSKALPEITDEEKPFDIPDSWEWVRLGDVANFMSGFAYKSNAYIEKSHNQVIRLGNVKNDQLVINKKQVFIDDDYANLTNNYRIKEGDILFTMTGTRNKRDYFYTLLVDKQSLYNRKLYLNQRVGCLNHFFCTDKLWLNYILKSQTILDEVFKNETGTVNQGNIGATKTMEIVMPLPPLSEQKRIAAKIAQLFALLRKVESSTQQYAKLQTLLKAKVLDLAMRGKLVKHDPNDKPASVLLEKIKAEKEQLIKEKKIKKSKPLPPITDEEKPFEIPDSWEWVRLGDLTAPVEYAMADGPFGSNLKKADYTLEPEVRIIQLSNIGENGWKDKNKKYTTFKHLEDIQRSEVFPGNIVIAKMMPAGRAIIVPNKDKKYVLSSDAVKFIPNQHILKSFLLCAINGPVYRKQVNSKLQGSTRPRTSLKKLKNFVLPLPPLSEQKRIAAKIAQLFALLRKDESLN